MHRKNRGKWLFTSESVTEGHPDKMCDQISDSILDSIIALDPNARVACESAVTTGLVMVIGEISTNCYVDIQDIVRKTVQRIGYDRGKYGFDSENCSVITSIHEQSPDIAMGVNESLEHKSGNNSASELLGAGDQGMMFGYACNDTEEKMPLPIALAHGLCRQLSYIRKEGTLNYLRPDGKAQVTVEYFNDKPVRIDTVVISTQHNPDVTQERIREDMIEYVIKKIIPENLLDINTNYYINPTGKFEIGGPKGDSGLTGRKIIVDTYGGFARHGGGAFSGKDPTKVDRSAAYAARYVAKNIVSSGLATECEIQVAYAIGKAEPVSITVDTFGTGVVEDSEIALIINKYFDLRPSEIIRKFDLKRPIYSQIAAYGHFGRTDLDLPWEKTDIAEKIRKEYLK